ncbi:MAG: hypothetical protein [Microviridae sp.]|nr:MAG: hypothetical protein [Microviridae sp.]
MKSASGMLTPPPNPRKPTAEGAPTPSSVDWDSRARHHYPKRTEPVRKGRAPLPELDRPGQRLESQANTAACRTLTYRRGFMQIRGFSMRNILAKLLRRLRLTNWLPVRNHRLTRTTKPATRARILRHDHLQSIGGHLAAPRLQDTTT